MPVLPAPAAPTHDLGGARFTSLATPTSGSTDTGVWLVEIDGGIVERRDQHIRHLVRGAGERRGVAGRVDD